MKLTRTKYRIYFKNKILIYLILFITWSNTIGAINKQYDNFCTIKLLFPASIFEWDSNLSTSLQLKYHHYGVEFEYGRVFELNDYNQGGPAFKAKAEGDRVRVNLKYYFIDVPTLSENIDYHFYLSILSSYKKVNYKMIWWLYDSLGQNGNLSYVTSYMPVKYSARNVSFNLLFGNEFFIKNLNLDYYAGIGCKFVDLQIPDSVPDYFVPYSRPVNS